MNLVTLLLKVTVKSVSLYASLDSSMFQCGSLLKSMISQLQVGCIKYICYKHLCIGTSHSS